MDKIKCLHCKKYAEVCPGNCTLYLFARQPWFSYIELLCPKCAQITRPFLGRDWRPWVQLCEQNEVGRIVEDWAPSSLIDQCNEVFGIEFLIPRQLGPRQERQIAFMHYLLERGVGEDELESA